MATLILSAIGTAIGGPIGGAIGALIGQQVDHAIFKPAAREGARLAEPPSEFEAGCASAGHDELDAVSNRKDIADADVFLVQVIDC